MGSQSSIVNYPGYIIGRGVDRGTDSYSEVNKRVDQSIKHSAFVLIFHFLQSFYSIWISLDNLMSEVVFLHPKTSFKSAYYNSIKHKFIVSRTSRVISTLRCNIRLINHAKYNIRGGDGSVFDSIQAFSRSQAKKNEYLHHLFDSSLTPEQSALASGTLIGSQTTINKNLKDDLITAGLIHVIVASGYNLMIMIGWVHSLLSLFLPKRTVLLLSLATIWWYAFLALYNPSVVRAAWMCSLSIIANIAGRPKSVWRTMLISILLLLVIQPALAGSISFQLSIFSTIGVLLVNQNLSNELVPEEQNLFQKVIGVFKENAKTTMGANLLTLPIIIFWFKRVSLISVVSNTLLLWLIPLLMYCSSLFVVFIHIHPKLGSLMLIPIRIISNIFLSGGGFFARFPYASIELRYISLSELIVFYSAIFSLVFFWRKLGFKKNVSAKKQCFK